MDPIDSGNAEARPIKRGTDSDEEPSELQVTQWSHIGNNRYCSTGPTVSKLPSGMYSIHAEQSKLIFARKVVNVDDLLSFPDSVSARVMSEIDTFWSNEAKFKRHGFLHRRGYLFYGPQGSGKTSIVNQICTYVINNGGLVFICVNPRYLISGLQEYRLVEPTRPIVCLFEDIDAIADHSEEALLSLLDGETQVNRVLNIATTNYPEKLDKRIVRRPRRFDQLVKIDMPSAEMRRIYFLEKLKLDADEVELWVTKSAGLSFAACAELVVSVKCLGNDFDTTVARLQNMMTTGISSREFESEVFGFASGKNT